MKTVSWGKELMRALAPTQIHTINCYLIQLIKGMRDDKRGLTKMLFESRSPSEFPLDVGNSNLWIIWLSVLFGNLLYTEFPWIKFIDGLVFAELLYEPAPLPEPFKKRPIVIFAYLPSCPYSFEPHVYNLPSFVRAAECLLPQDI